jgi:hypothetical protein
VMILITRQQHVQTSTCNALTVAESHIAKACSFPVVPVTGIQSSSAQPSIAVSTATSLPSRPFVPSSMMTTNIDAQTQTPTAVTLPTTSVYQWSNRDNPCVNTPGQRQVPPPRCRNCTGLLIHSFIIVSEHPPKC